jgi:Protein of unknown function (DUF4199)
METTPLAPTPTAVGIRYGLLTGLVTAIFSFVMNVAHMEQSPLRFLSLLVLIGGIVLALRFYKANTGGFMSFGQGVGIGTVLSAMAGVIGAVFSYVYINFVDPEMVTRIMDKARADMEARGGMSDEQIDQAMSFTAKFMNGPILAASVVLGTIIFGLLASLVVSAVLKNPRPDFE